MSKRYLSQRPDNFRLKYDHPLAQGLVFAGLGSYTGGIQYYDSSLFRNHGVFTNFTPSTDWKFVSDIGRFGCVSLDASGTRCSISCAWDCTRYTLAAWAIPSAQTISATILSIEPSGKWGVIGTHTDGTYGLHAYGGSTVGSDINTSVTGIVTHVCGIMSNGSVLNGYKLYLNGIYKAQEVSQAFSTVVAAYVCDNVNSSRNEFNGIICDPMIWNRALSLSELSILADPSNVMLSGMIEPPKRKLYTISYHPITEQSLITKIGFKHKNSSIGIKILRSIR